MNILRYKATANKCGVSIITIRRWATQPEYKNKGFPNPLVLGENSVGFVEEEVEKWLAEQVAKRDGAA